MLAAFALGLLVVLVPDVASWAGPARSGTSPVHGQVVPSVSLPLGLLSSSSLSPSPSPSPSGFAGSEPPAPVYTTGTTSYETPSGTSSVYDGSSVLWLQDIYDVLTVGMAVLIFFAGASFVLAWRGR